MTDTNPHVMNALSPHLVCDGAAEAIAFYKKAFGAEEIIRLEGPNGKLMHATIKILGCSVMLVDEDTGCAILSPKALNGSPVTLHLIVPDADAAVARAVEAGAEVTMPLEDMFWGDRYGVLKDPFGHNWSVATPQRAMSKDEILDAMHKAFSPA